MAMRKRRSMRRASGSGIGVVMPKVEEVVLVVGGVCLLEEPGLGRIRSRGISGV
jgi:hypothetical protein